MKAPVVAYFMLSYTTTLSHVIHCLYSVLWICSTIMSNPAAFAASHPNSTLYHKTLINKLLWTPYPYFLRPHTFLGLFGCILHKEVHMVVICLHPLVLSRHQINNFIIGFFIHFNSILIIYKIFRVCIKKPNC
jgi:hypothetical protein